MHQQTLSLLADTLISKIKEKTDCFETTTIVFPNIVSEQFFKSYWLKTQNDNVLMNVEFKRINDVLPSLVDQPNYKLINKSNLTQIILTILTNDSGGIIPQKYKSYYENNCVKLYDFAISLANLFLSYYKDNYFSSSEFINSWQYPLYQKIIGICSNNDLGTIELPIVRTNSNKKIYFFGFNKFDKVYRDLIDKCNFVYEYALTLDENIIPNYEIYIAPSKLREIEHIHSLVSSLLLNGSHPSDFLVIAPNISEYENEIERVFHQNDINFPNIPYVIRNTKKIKSDLTSALASLFNVSKKGFFTRLDFYDLLTNPLIALKRNISPTDVDNYMNTIINLNIFRDHPFNNDWDYLKKRLLLSKISSINFTDKIVSLSDKDYLPYSNISFSDGSIINLISIINDLNAFTKLINSKKYIDNELIDNLKIELDKWLFIDDETSSSNKEYRNIICSLNTFKKLDSKNIPIDLLAFTLLDCTSYSSIQKGNAFIDGITFVDYDINLVYSANRIFFIGASSNNIPKVTTKSELDIRDTKNDNDDELTFKLLSQNALEKLYISYVYIDLKDDTEYYLSPVIDVLNKKAHKYLDNQFYKIPLDETREYRELFTRKEFSDKEYFKNLLSNKSHEVMNVNETSKEDSIIFYESLTTRQLANFLKEPLKEKASYLFNKDNDIEEEIKNEYEPFSLDILNEYKLSDKIIFSMINSSFEYNSMLSVIELSNLIPTINKEYEDTLYSNIVNECSKTINTIKDVTRNNYQIINPRSLKILTTNNENWTLSSNDYIAISISGNTRTYMELKLIQNKSHRLVQFLNLYINSLLDISSINDDNVYHIVLSKGLNQKDIDDKYKDRCSWEFDITSSEATKILNNLHYEFGNYTHNVFAPLKYVQNNINSYTNLIKDISDKDVWKFFPFAKLFNHYSDLGYEQTTFTSTVFLSELNKQLEHIKFLDKKLEEDDIKDGKQNSDSDI